MQMTANRKEPNYFLFADDLGVSGSGISFNRYPFTKSHHTFVLGRPNPESKC